MDKTQQKYGEKVVCKRPETLAVCFQVVNIDIGHGDVKQQINVDFCGWENGQPNYSVKKTVRINSGEIAMLIGCLLGYQEKSGAGHRESGLWLSFNDKNGDKFINLWQAKQQLNYVKLTNAESFQIFSLCIEALKREGQTSSDVLFEVKSFFGVI